MNAQPRVMPRFPLLQWIHALRHHPITTYERLHLERAAPRKRRRLIWLMVLLLIIGTIAKVFGEALWVAGGTNARYSDAYLLTLQIAGFCAFAAGGFMIAQNAIVMGQGMRYGAGTIAREKQARTWESLILTAVPATKLITTKWAGVMRFIWHKQEVSVVLRAVIALWFMLSPELTGRQLISRPLEIVLLSAAVCMVIPFFTSAFASASGILASSLSSQEGAAIRTSSALQFGVFAAFLIFGCGAAPLVFYGENTALGLIIAALVLTWLDGGIIAVIGVLLNTSEDNSDILLYFGGVGIWMIAIVLLTIAALSLARWIVIGQGASAR